MCMLFKLMCRLAEGGGGGWKNNVTLDECSLIYGKFLKLSFMCYLEISREGKGGGCIWLSVFLTSMVLVSVMLLVGTCPLKCDLNLWPWPPLKVKFSQILWNENCDLDLWPWPFVKVIQGQGSHSSWSWVSVTAILKSVDFGDGRHWFSRTLPWFEGLWIRESGLSPKECFAEIASTKDFILLCLSVQEEQ